MMAVEAFVFRRTTLIVPRGDLVQEQGRGGGKFSLGRAGEWFPLLLDSQVQSIKNARIVERRAGSVQRAVQRSTTADADPSGRSGIE